MRIAYLDESGISNQRHEPIVVVAGVVVHADGQLRQVERRLRDLADEHVPKHARAGFAFHAKDIFSGGKPFDRNAFPERDARWRILEDLCRIPHDLALPVCFGWADRNELAQKHPGSSTHDVAVAAQAIAACQCTLAIERHMRSLASDEVAMLIYEDNQSAKNLVTDMQRRFVAGNFDGSMDSGAEWARVLPLTNIVGDPVFAPKSGASLLQLADVCAFTLKRRMMGTTESDRFLRHFEGQLFLKPKSWPQIKRAET